MERGVLIAQGLTSEAAYSKKMAVILSEGVERNVAADLFSVNICGDSNSVFYLRFGSGQTELAGDTSSCVVDPQGSSEPWKFGTLANSLLLAELWIFGVAIATDKAVNRVVEIEVQIVDLSESIPLVMGTLTRSCLRWEVQGPLRLSAILDVTATVHELLAPNRGLRVESLDEPVAWREIGVTLYAAA
jgi:hypothetical protein